MLFYKQHFALPVLRKGYYERMSSSASHAAIAAETQQDHFMAGD